MRNIIKIKWYFYLWTRSSNGSRIDRVLDKYYNIISKQFRNKSYLKNKLIPFVYTGCISFSDLWFVICLYWMAPAKTKTQYFDKYLSTFTCLDILENYKVSKNVKIKYHRKPNKNNSNPIIELLKREHICKIKWSQMLTWINFKVAITRHKLITNKSLTILIQTSTIVAKLSYRKQ